jgi:hypothetical protein
MAHRVERQRTNAAVLPEWVAPQLTQLVEHGAGRRRVAAVEYLPPRTAEHQKRVLVRLDQRFDPLIADKLAMMATDPALVARTEANKVADVRECCSGLRQPINGGDGTGRLTPCRAGAVNLWTVGCADPRLTAQARSLWTSLVRIMQMQTVPGVFFQSAMTSATAGSCGLTGLTRANLSGWARCTETA